MVTALIHIFLPKILEAYQTHKKLRIRKREENNQTFYLPFIVYTIHMYVCYMNVKVFFVKIKMLELLCTMFT